MKKAILISAMATMGLGLAPTAQGASLTPELYINETEVTPAPFVQNGETFVPVGTIVGKMGGTVLSYAQHKLIVRENNGKVVVVMNGMSIGVVNGQAVPLDIKTKTKAVEENGDVYVPTSFVSAGLGYTVNSVTQSGQVKVYVAENNQNPPKTVTVTITKLTPLQTSTTAKPTNQYELVVNGQEVVGPNFYVGFATPINYKGDICVPLMETADAIPGAIWNVSDNYDRVTLDLNKNTTHWEFTQTKSTTNNSYLYDAKPTLLNDYPVDVSSYPTITQGFFSDGADFYVPQEFVSYKYGFNLPERIEVTKGLTTVYIGSPLKLIQYKEVAGKGQNFKTWNFDPFDTHNVYPRGWKAPQLTAKWSPNRSQNRKVIDEQLGFKNGFYSFRGGANAVGLDDSLPNEEGISFTCWGTPPDVYDTQTPERYRVAIISAQLFKFYFGNDWKRVWNYFNSGNIPDHFTAGGRNVRFVEYKSTHQYELWFGLPHKK